MLLTSCKVRRVTAVRETTKTYTELNNLDISRRLKLGIESWLGVPYRYGGKDKKGIDCSGLVCELYKLVYKEELPKTVRLQYETCKKIPMRKLREGDLIFFNPETKDVTHVGLYLSANKFVQASVSKGVIISDLGNTYYKKHVVCGGRF